MADFFPALTPEHRALIARRQPMFVVAIAVARTPIRIIDGLPTRNPSVPPVHADRPGF